MNSTRLIADAVRTLALCRPLRLPVPLLLVTGLMPATASPAELLAAVATNFAPAMEQLVPVFEAASGHRVTVTLGSSGKLTAQIIRGAPFDLFLSADQNRPQRLEAEGFAVAGSRFTYVLGVLVLWSAVDAVADGETYLKAGNYRALAIANPQLAPYGRAAEQTLRALRLWTGLQPRIARAENVGQTYAMVASGAAQAGFVAASIVPGTGNAWVVPTHLYDPIVQQAVLTRHGRGNAAAREFLQFLRGDAAAAVIRALGYRLPETADHGP